MSFRFFRFEYIEFVIIQERKIDFKEHCHAFDYVLTYICNGKVFLKTDISSEINQNDIFVVTPYQNHSLHSDQPVTMISMCIKKELFQLSKSIFESEISKASDILDHSIKDLFFRTALNTYFNTVDSFEGEYSVINSRLYIESFPENEYNVDYYADMSYMSKYHYIRIFRKYAGLTPHKFIIQNRIRKAQQILINGGSITDAALSSGFYDQSHFDKCFKKIVGISPKEYINSVSNFLQE